MKFSILDSRDSLMLEKTFLDYRRGQKTKTFYEKNHSLSLWLKWTEKSWKKLKYALLWGFHDYIFWNSNFYVESKFFFIIDEPMSTSTLTSNNNDIKMSSCFAKAYMTWACTGGSLFTVKTILQEPYWGQLILVEDYAKYLTIACSNGHLDIIEYMIKEKSIQSDCSSSICFLDHDILRGHDLIQTACEHGQFLVLEYLISMCDEASKLKIIATLDGYIFAACNGGNLKIVKLIMDNGPEKLRTDRYFTEKGFYIAIKKKNIHLAQYFLSRDFKIDTLNTCQYYINALFNGDQDIIEILSFAVSDNNLLCLKFYATGDLDKIITYNSLLRNIGYFPYLAEGYKLACKYGHVDIINNIFLLNHNILHISVILISFGFDLACFYGHQDIVKLLYAYRNTSLTTSSICSACRGGNIEIVKLLLSLGAEAKCGFNAACKYGHLDIVELLLLAEPNMPLHRLESSFYDACSAGNIKIVKLCWQKMNKQNRLLMAGLKYAIQSHREDVIAFFFNIGIPQEKMIEVLYIASQCYSLDIIFENRGK